MQLLANRYLFGSIVRLAVTLTLLLNVNAWAESDEEIEQSYEVGSYSINPGDVLGINVWNEPTLSTESVLVRPDGFFSVPVLGEVRAGGKTADEVRLAVIEGLKRFLKDEPAVVVSVLRTTGSEIYVLGKVSRPGVFPLTGPMDVTQALANAGGPTSFAAENKIKVLRRDNTGVQRAIKFKYGDIKDGDQLETNILLQSGDLVLVP